MCRTQIRKYYHNKILMLKCRSLNIKIKRKSLAGVAQWIECWLANQRVTGLIPSKSTCLGCRPGPLWGHTKGNHTLILSPSLFASFPLCLKINKYNIFFKVKGKEGKYKGIPAFCIGQAFFQVCYFFHKYIRFMRHGYMLTRHSDHLPFF